MMFMGPSAVARPRLTPRLSDVAWWPHLLRLGPHLSPDLRRCLFLSQSRRWQQVPAPHQRTRWAQLQRHPLLIIVWQQVRQSPVHRRTLLQRPLWASRPASHLQHCVRQRLVTRPALLGQERRRQRCLRCLRRRQLLQVQPGAVAVVWLRPPQPWTSLTAAMTSSQRKRRARQHQRQEKKNEAGIVHSQPDDRQRS